MSSSTTVVTAAKARKRRVNFARLNHILVPQRSEERDRYRRGALRVVLFPVGWLHGALTREGRALVGIALMVGVAGLDVGNSQVYLLWAALSGLIVGSLIARPLYGMRGAKLRVVSPKRATAGEPVRFDVELEAARPVRAIRVETPFLPWDGRWLDRPPGIASASANERGRTSAMARFVERGEHHLDPFSARAMVPFGLAAGSAAKSGTTRFLVLPRPARVGDIELASGATGKRRRTTSSALGPSGDLAGVRPYRPGDPIRHLHARTWARVGVPHVREHVRERSERAGLLLLVDARSDEKLVEAAISLAAGVAAVLAAKTGGLGLVALGDEARHAHPSAPASTIVDEAMDRLAVYRAPATIDPNAVLAAVSERLGEISSLIVIAADRDAAPDEPTPEATEVIEALKRTSVGVRALLVVEEDVVAEPGRPIALIGRAAIEGEVEIRV